MSDGAASAIAWNSFSSLARFCSALPDVVWNACESWAPRVMSFAQFFVLANDGDAETVVLADVVEPVVPVLAGEAEFFLPPPPQPAAITTTARSRTDANLNLIV